MKKDVKKLQNLVEKEKNRCEIKEVRMRNGMDIRVAAFQKDTKVVMPSKKMMKDKECLLMAMTEPPFTDELKKVHLEKLAKEKC